MAGAANLGLRYVMARQPVQLDADDITSLFLVRGRGAFMAREVRRIAAEKGVTEQQVADAFQELTGLERSINLVLSAPLIPLIIGRQRLGSFIRRFRE